MIVVDSTVIAAWGVQVPHSAKAAKLLDGEEGLAAPEGALTAALEGLRRVVRAGHLAETLFRELAGLLPAMLTTIVPDVGLLGAAARHATERNLTMEAALCLALAERRHWNLASADPELIAAAGGLLPAEKLVRIRA